MLTPEQAALKAELELWDAHVSDVLEMWRDEAILYKDSHPSYHDREKTKAARQRMCEQLQVYGEYMVNMRVISR